MKFYVGDKVKVLDGSKIKNYTGGFTNAMEDDIGKIFTIESMKKYPGNRYGFRYSEPLHLFGGVIYDKRGLELVERGPNAPKRKKKAKEGKTLERGELVKTFMKLTETDKPLKRLTDKMPIIVTTFVFVLSQIEKELLGEG